MNEQELLAVLDMDEDFQWNFLIARQDIQEMCQNQLDAWCESKYKRRVLADLAFQLRDEIGNGMMFDDLNRQFEVYKKVLGKRAENPQIPQQDHFAVWWILHSKPIHWIIAALIAKEKAND